MQQLPYDKRDYNSILNYLKSKAEVLSNGKWTDFSDGDIGTVILKLISYLADMNNYQIDKGLSELYLDTLNERESALSLIKLIGYEPRGYKSSFANIDITLKPGKSVPDGSIIKSYTKWTNAQKSVYFYNVKDYEFLDNKCSLKVYEGDLFSATYKSDAIDSNSRLYLEDNNVDNETLNIIVSGDSINQVDNVLLDTSNTLSYSVHTDTTGQVYIQFPSYWSDFITNGTPINVKYLKSSGSNGNVGSHVITRPYITLNLGVQDEFFIVDNLLPSEGGQDPETVEEIKLAAPMYASTMNTLVTLEDLELVKYVVDGISDIVALDYNSPESGLVQPADAYKVKLYVLPTDKDYIIDPNSVLTDVGKELKQYVDSRRLTSIKVDYNNVGIVTPNIKVVAYINKYDLRATGLAETITNIILKNYSKGNIKIGEGIYSSKLSKQILDEIDYCNYIEIQLPDDSYIPNRMQFLKVIRENIVVQVVEE